MRIDGRCSHVQGPAHTVWGVVARRSRRSVSRLPRRVAGFSSHSRRVSNRVRRCETAPLDPDRAARVGRASRAAVGVAAPGRREQVRDPARGPRRIIAPTPSACFRFMCGTLSWPVILELNTVRFNAVLVLDYCGSS